MRDCGGVAWYRVAALALLILAVGASRAEATSHLVQYAYTSSPATFTVPTGVTSLTVFAAGSEGGFGSSVAGPGGIGGAPGAGGTVTGTLAVQPGDVVTVDVGNFGASATFSDPSCQASSTTSVPGPGGTTPSAAGRQQAGAGGANAAIGEGGSGFSASPRACEAGSGGGGGAYTLISLGGTVVAAAAGGGGGGGGGVALGETGGAGGNGNGSGGYGGDSIDGAAGGGTVSSSAGHGHVAAMDGGTGGDSDTPSGGGGGGGLGYLTSGAGGAGADLSGAGGGGGGGTSYLSGLTNSTVAVNTIPEQGYAAISYVDPPTAAISAPASGGTYTLGQSVTTSFSCAEDPAGPGLSGCVDGNGTSGTPSGFGPFLQVTAEAGTGHLDTTTPGPHTYTVTASSVDGETGTTSITYTVAGPPTAQINSPFASGGVYAVNQPVSTTFSCTVGISGAPLQACQDSRGDGPVAPPGQHFNASSVNANGVLDTTSVGPHTYSVTATAIDGQSAQAQITYTVASAPTAQIQGPASGGTYAYGQSVPTQFSCSPGNSDPGLSSCDDSTGTDTAHGGTGYLDTSSAGQHTYTVTATSQDGQTGTAQISYTVQPLPSPTVKINSPASGGTYAEGQSVATQFTCSEGAGGPGLTSCLDSAGKGFVVGSGQTLRGGGALVTSSPGTFTYSVTATSQDGDTGTAQITYTVAPPPTCQPVSTSTPPGQAVTVQLSCTDSAGAALTYAIVAGPSNGTLGMINQSTGQVTYTPNSGYSGPDSFTYNATSSNGTATTQTVSITVVPAPTCQPVSTSTPAGQAVTVQLSCTDSAGAALTYAIVAGPSNGTLGMINQSTGQVTYTPNSGYSGPDSFTYNATSSNGTAMTQTVSITVVPAPTCQPVSTSTPAGQAVTVQLSCTDSAGAALTYAIVAGPSNGTLGMINQTTGQVVYTPNAGYSGPDSFTYDATSSNGTATARTVSITVTPVTPTGADLGVGLSLFPGQVHYLSPLIYTATVTNHGPGAASAVQLKDTLPAGVRSLLITHPAGWSCSTPRVLSSGTITCTSANLASGATARFHFAVGNLEPRGGTLHDTAAVSATSTDPNPANNQATITTKVS